jgi:uncharacterized membrane protein
MDGSGSPEEFNSLDDIQKKTAETNADKSIADKNNTINPEVVSSTSAPSRIVIRRLDSVSIFRGPLPPAEELEKYNQVIPNGADRIMAMAEKEQSHRQNIESLEVNSASSQIKRGQFFGFTMSMSALVFAAYLFNMGRDGYAISLVCGNYLVIAGAFIGLRLWPNRNDDQELDNEDK